MKRMLVFFVMALFLSSPQAHAGKTVPSKITGVTLYSNQALLQREASADVGVGINELHLPVRAFSIDSSSAFAKVFGKGKIISVQVRSIPRSASPREKIRRLEETIEKLREDKQAILDKKASVSRQEKFLDSVVQFSETQMSKEIETRMLDSETLNNTFELLGNRYHEIFKKKQPLIKTSQALKRISSRRIVNCETFGSPKKKSKRGSSLYLIPQKSSRFELSPNIWPITPAGHLSTVCPCRMSAPASN